jgi:histidinol-phosphate/aromatic aminotransferase/cobyric acid decarboxylase-like protein
MRSKANDVIELDMLEDLDDLADEYARAFGKPPFNVSHWDSARSFTDRIAESLPLSRLPNVFDYQYSYELEAAHPALVRKLGFPAGRHACLITPSGTSAIVCLLNLLRTLPITGVVTTSPVYFPVIHNAAAYGIRLTHRPMIRRTGGFRLSPSILSDQIPPSEAIWVTNPVYSAGVYLADEDIAALRRHSDRGGLVIADEALAIPGRELSRALGSHENFLGLYTPHKALCVNGVKFGAIVADGAYQRHFDHWADVLIGGIGIGATVAVEHFLSDRFDQYQRAYMEQILEGRHFVDALADRLPGIELDRDASGHFVSMYASKIPGDLDLAGMRALTWASGASFITGRRNHFGEGVPFCWRINLARDGDPFRAALGRLATAASQHSPP